MRIKISVKPNARKDEVIKADDGSLTIRVAMPPVEGKANERIIEVLADYFGKPKRNVSILAGFKGRKKLVEIQ